MSCKRYQNTSKPRRNNSLNTGIGQFVYCDIIRPIEV